MVSDDLIEIVHERIAFSLLSVGPAWIFDEVATSNATCSNGLVGLEDSSSTVCCDSSCSQCGGVGCGDTTTPGLSGDDCCSSDITTNGQFCSVTESAPCILDPPEATANTTCSNGLIGVENSGGTVCCDSRCSQCGGSGCGDIIGLSGDDCCSSNIELNGQVCSVTGSAPCVLDTPEVVPSTCSNGLAGVQSEDGTICCAEACNGQCGGVGCGTIDGTNGALDCCLGTILASGVNCDAGVESPCIIVSDNSTDAPTASPVDMFTFSPTIGSRGGQFSMSPTVLLEQTSAPTSGSRRVERTEAPTMFDSTGAPTIASRVGGSTSIDATMFPGVSMGPTSDAAAMSAGFVVTLAAMASGIFAVFAAARK